MRPPLVTSGQASTYEERPTATIRLLATEIVSVPIGDPVTVTMLILVVSTRSRRFRRRWTGLRDLVSALLGPAVAGREAVFD